MLVFQYNHLSAFAYFFEFNYIFKTQNTLLSFSSRFFISFSLEPPAVTWALFEAPITTSAKTTRFFHHRIVQFLTCHSGIGMQNSKFEWSKIVFKYDDCEPYCTSAQSSNSSSIKFFKCCLCRCSYWRLYLPEHIHLLVSLIVTE